jgi:integrase
MSFTIRRYLKSVVHADGCNKKRCGTECKRELDGFEYDIRITFPNGKIVRERKRVPLDKCTKSIAREWAEKRERELYSAGPPKEVDPLDEMTVRDLAEEWIKARTARDLETSPVGNYRNHIEPLLGEVRMRELGRRHVEQFLEHLTSAKGRGGGPLAPGSQRQIFYNLHSIFRRAVSQGYLSHNPVQNGSGDLPMNTDKDLEWRETARFTPDEVAQLISDPRVPEARRVAYAIQFLTGVRPGEASALRWSDYDPSAKPLGKLKVSRAYSSSKRKEKGTKTGRIRIVPVLPHLASMLERWRSDGWVAWVGSPPETSDLIIPTAKGGHRSSGPAMHQFKKDLRALGFRSRRHYDTRRTFISMALDGGANPVHTQYMTHAPPQGEFWKYLTAEYDKLCDALKCLEEQLGYERMSLPAESEAGQSVRADPLGPEVVWANARRAAGAYLEVKVNENEESAAAA